MKVKGDVLPHPSRPLPELISEGLGTKPDSIAIVSATDSLTWKELDEASSSLAAAYLSLGLEPGDRLASLMPNRIALAIHYLACFKAGLVITPLNYRYTHREIDHALSVSGASALVAHVERVEDLAASEMVPGLRVGVIAFGADEQTESNQGEPPDPLFGRLPAFEELIATEIDGFLPAEPSSDDPAAVFFTSGSTGPAKGVTHTNETIRWMIASAVAAFEIGPDDVFLPGSSMSHIGSFLWTLSALEASAKVVLARTFDSHEILPLLREHQPTVMAMIPAALSALINDHDLDPQDLSCLKICRSGADSVSTELLAEFAEKAGFPIDEGYGMTEVGLATLNPPYGEIRQGSIGPPVPGFQIEIRGEDGAVAGPGEVGKVWIKSRSRMAGYWKAADATGEVVIDGWLDSGDLAHADEDGYIWFFGRKKQVIVHDGSNISPLEVEESLLEHPTVDLSGVVGIHDPVHGENVRAYVTIHSESEAPTAAELIRFSRDRVGYKAPEEVVILEEMPLNPTGKIDRAGLKKMAETHLNPHDAEA